ncbi:MAG: DUF389 domain-containing protein [Nocardioidaceae bacterium]
MLSLRVVVPAHLTDRVVDVLDDDPAVSALVVQRGAALKPAGDLVEADVAREAANDVVERLRDLGVPQAGTLHLTPVETWMSRAAFEAQHLAPGSPADSVVWASVTQQAYDESELNWSYTSFMTLATLLAGVAIIVDSPILVIGAMVLGPEFTAIAGLGVALVRRRGTLFRRAARTLVGGFAVAMAVTALVTLGGRLLGWVSLEDVSGPRPGTDFIYHPDRWSLVVAVIAAAAGVLSLTSSRIGGLSGVFISVTTIPAAANVAVGLTFGAWHEVVGSSLQLAINLTGMTLAGWLVLALQQVVWKRVSAYRARLVARRRAADG